MIALFSEFIGTFALISSILFTGNALIIGLTLATIIWAIGDISGAHVNPVVSYIIYLKGDLSFIDYLYYITSQFIGGISAFYTYKYLS